MAMKLKMWIVAFRLHTLPLVLAGVGLGNMIPASKGHFNIRIGVFSLATAIFIQIMANLSNDYGDAKHGADIPERVGPKRFVQSGDLKSKEILRMILLFAVLSLLSGLILLYFSLQNVGLIPINIMLLIGLLSIWASWHYTASKKPYGYKGLGDIFVFIFFGIVSVWGTDYLQQGFPDLKILLPATSIGFFSTAVLNINNIRDIATDSKTGKMTLPVFFGEKKAKIYHLILLGLGLVGIILFCYPEFQSSFRLFFLTPLILFPINGYMVYRANSQEKFTPLLKQLSFFILISVISTGIGLNI